MALLGRGGDDGWAGGRLGICDLCAVGLIGVHHHPHGHVRVVPLDHLVLQRVQPLLVHSINIRTEQFFSATAAKCKR